MEHKEAIDILMNILKKYSLTEEEIEAIKTSIGVLSWTALAKSRVRAIREKKEGLKNK